MNYGEKLIHQGSGIVTGSITGRLVAKFSHESEADSFCEAASSKAPTDNGIDEMDNACKRYNEGDIDITNLVCTLWNTALVINS